MGFEPTTYALRERCSTTELLRQAVIGDKVECTIVLLKSAIQSMPSSVYCYGLPISRITP